MYGPNSPSFTNLNVLLAGTWTLAMKKKSDVRNKKKINIAEENDILFAYWWCEYRVEAVGILWVCHNTNMLHGEQSLLYLIWN